eukprot:scaffold14307_cov177-Cylindrotheca_fusiformis.AAC.4
MKFSIALLVIPSLVVQYGIGFVIHPPHCSICGIKNNLAKLRVASDEASEATKPKIKPVILEPYLPAADPIESEEKWTPDEVFPKWKDRFPDPPDFIGMQRIYSKDIDGPCLRNNQSLVRSIPVENKASYLKKHMMPFGFTGYKVSEQCWIRLGVM